MGNIVEIADTDAREYVKAKHSKLKIRRAPLPASTKPQKIDKDFIPRKPRPCRPYQPDAKPIVRKGKKTYHLVDAVTYAEHSPRVAIAQVKRNRLRSVRPGALVLLAVEMPNCDEMFWAAVKSAAKPTGSAKIIEPMLQSWMHGLEQGDVIPFKGKHVLNVALHARIVDNRLYQKDEIY